MNGDASRPDAPVALPADGTVGQLWAALLDLAEVRPHGWSLVGALLVMLHELEAGVVISRATADADTVVEARGISGATRQMSRVRLELRTQPARRAAAEQTHRHLTR